MGIRQAVAAALAAAATVGVLASHGHAQTFPNKPVKMVITFTPGSATDIIGRVVGQKLSELWGQPVVPENRAGAGGSIASAFVAKAEPDGYTLLVNSNAHTVNPAIYARLPYDTLKDFANVSPMVMAPQVLVVAQDGKFKSVMDLVNYGKSKPEALNFAHAGVGSGTHLNMEVFIAAAGIKVTPISYKGTPESFTAVLGGSADAFWVPLSAGLATIRSGKLRALAVSTPKRSPALPDVPTTGEAGVPHADSPGWFGIWAPTATPAAVVEKINGDVRRALKDPGVREKLVGLGGDPLDMSTGEFSKYVADEIARSKMVIERAGVKPQ